MKYSIAINNAEVVTPFGVGINPLWSNLISKKTAIKPCTRFSVENFACKKCSNLDLTAQHGSLLWSLIEPIAENIKNWQAEKLILATTKGEIDLLEQECRTKQGKNGFLLSDLLSKMLKYLEIKEGILISAACASSSAAIARGAEIIQAGKAEKVAVVGIDLVSFFVFSGFSALQALSVDNNSDTPAKPFDANRDGLVVGEACGALLLERKINKEGAIAGNLVGWGSAADANHVTGPSRDGSGLASAICASLNMSGIDVAKIGAISAHGTGTLYNDNMEMLAFRSVFDQAVPVFSVKGALGHTMGASGVLETIVSLKALQEGVVPPTVGFSNPDANSAGWVSGDAVNFSKDYLLKTNSGFGGINTSLLLAGR